MALLPTIPEQAENSRDLKAKWEAQIERTKEALSQLNKIKANLQNWKRWVQELSSIVSGPPNFNDGYGLEQWFYSYAPGEPAEYFNDTSTMTYSWIPRGRSRINTLEQSVTQYQKVYDQAVKLEKEAKKRYEESRGKATPPTPKPDPTDEPPIPKPGTIPDPADDSTDPETDTNNPVLKNVDAKKVKLKFNIPMVKSAYYGGNATHFLSENVLETRPNWVLTDNGRRMWQGEKGGKGVIQPNLTVAASQLSKTYKNSKAIVKDLNNKLYGFRFLYNPTSVSMNWGINQEVDYNTIGLGLDKGVPLTGNLAASSVSFELVLNRIEDLNVINSDGTLKVPGNPWPTVAVPDKEELKELYQRGTMYDLEHLFATLIPGAPKYRSNLNGILSDRGYMSGYVVELHLGPKLRFSVQISDINVEHAMFNDRMVPMFSNVRIVATRLPDVAKGTIKGEGIQI